MHQILGMQGTWNRQHTSNPLVTKCCTKIRTDLCIKIRQCTHVIGKDTAVMILQLLPSGQHHTYHKQGGMTHTVVKARRIRQWLGLLQDSMEGYIKHLHLSWKCFLPDTRPHQRPDPWWKN